MVLDVAGLESAKAKKACSVGNSKAKVQKPSKARVFGNFLALSNVPEGALSHLACEPSLRTCLLRAALGLLGTHPLAPGPCGCHSSVARLVHLWAQEAVLWFGTFF